MEFMLQEATIRQLQQAMEAGEQTAVSMTTAYLQRIAEIDQDGPMLRSVIELNPDAIYIAMQMDQERAAGRIRSELHGIPVLIKDNINTGDHMHTTAGSLALSDSFAPEDAFLVKRLRAAGAVILGKTNLTEMANFMAIDMKNGYSSRGGQTLNPYGPGQLDVGGSSSGSGAAVAANLCVVAVGTETDGSIMSPSANNSLVGIKPTLGLISRTGIIPITYTQDTAGPMARTVTDAVILLGILAGQDEQDAATLVSPAEPVDYTASLDPDGLRGARIGINRYYMKDLTEEERTIMEASIEAMRHAGAVIVEGTNLPESAQEPTVLLYEFKSALNRYLSTLGPGAPVRTLKEMIDYNHLHHRETLKYGQQILLAAEYETSGRMTESKYIQHRLQYLKNAREDGIDRLLREHQLDAIFSPRFTDTPAVAGYPCIIVPAGYRRDGLPFGINFMGTAYSEPELIRIAYAFEQVVPARRSPVL
ncbi:amidase [Paenibacillus bovis]|uniref:Amidase n=2 Tax=Paenibacillus bovis TaxID=1616788 RepID=A0A172ZGH4_9BACL|nr:amidase [Paenibacillus bovis]ANF96230.1 amidase [Paenibacillus bovis]